MGQKPDFIAILRRAEKVLQPFAEAQHAIERVQELDRDARLGWVHVSGSGASGGFRLQEGNFSEAWRLREHLRHVLAQDPQS